MKKRKYLALGVFCMGLAVTPTVSAMHIMEGYLPPKYCIAWGILCVPFLVYGFCSLRRMLQENRRNITLLAMAGAFIFVISSLKIPSVTGSCSHMTGTGLGAILFGPAQVSILGIIVLIFQAILLAHGKTNWVKNILAAGEADIRLGRHNLHLVNPRVVPAGTDDPSLPGIARNGVKRGVGGLASPPSPR